MPYAYACLEFDYYLKIISPVDWLILAYFIHAWPQAEQHRIVAKVDQLMALCDKLEKQIDVATDK